MEKRIYKTFENVSAHDKALVQQIIMRLTELTDMAEEVVKEQIDSTDHPEEMKNQAKSALHKQYNTFRAILDTVVFVDGAPENELPS